MVVPPATTTKPFPGCCRMVTNSRCLPVLRTILPLQIAEGLLFSGDGRSSHSLAAALSALYEPRNFWVMSGQRKWAVYPRGSL
jgi:hypothetical protein